MRRPARPGTPTTQSLLAHLHAVGFAGAPRPLGIDDRGREVLSYVVGAVAWPDHFTELLDTDDALARVGRLIRELHDALATFVPPADAVWQVVIPPDRVEQVVHHDLAPWNLVCGKRWAFIDWDFAGPGSRLWDLAYAAHGFVPLSADPTWDRIERAHRLRVLVDAYDLDEPQRRELASLLAPRARGMADFLRNRARVGEQPWAALWNQGHGAVWSADADLIEREHDRLLAALLA